MAHHAWRSVARTTYRSQRAASALTGAFRVGRRRYRNGRAAAVSATLNGATARGRKRERPCTKRRVIARGVATAKRLSAMCLPCNRVKDERGLGRLRADACGIASKMRYAVVFANGELAFSGASAINAARA